MAKPKVTEREVRAARAFLHYLHGNEQNTYLLLAVISWLRALAQAHDAFWKGLRTLSPQAAGYALAKHLLAKARSDSKDYGPLLRRLRQQLRKDTDLVTQAKDFLLSIEKSPWAKGTFYAYKPFVPGHYETQWVYYDGGRPVQQTVWVPDSPENDPLTLAWYALTDHPNIPAKWYVDSTRTVQHKVIPPRPRQPRAMFHVRPTFDFIQPYAAMRFYHEKPHYGENLIGGD